MELIEITDEAIVKLLEKQEKENFKYIRLGITGGGCAGFEYIFDSVRDYSDDDIVIDFGKLQFVVDKISVPYINGMTLFIKLRNISPYSCCLSRIIWLFQTDAYKEFT